MNTPNVESIINSGEEFTIPISLLSIDKLIEQLISIKKPVNVSFVEHKSTAVSFRTIRVNPEIEYLEESESEKKSKDIDEYIRKNYSEFYNNTRASELFPEYFKKFEEIKQSLGVQIPKIMHIDYKILYVNEKSNIAKLFKMDDKVASQFLKNTKGKFRNFIISRDGFESITIKGDEIFLNSKNDNFMILLVNELRRPLTEKEFSEINK
jgi:hypothetical protein